MKSINKVILIGNIGKDPEIRSMNNGIIAANFSIATTEIHKNPNGEKVKVTEWHNMAFFGKLAEIIRDYAKKGSLVYAEGKIKTEKYKAKDGTERYSCKIYGDVFRMLGGKDSKNLIGESNINEDIDF